MDENPKLLKNLIAKLVEFQIQQDKNYNLNFNIQNEEQLLKFRTLGKVGGSVEGVEYEEPDIKEEIEKAYIGFRHNRYHIFINNEQIIDLDEEIFLEENSEVLINYILEFF